MPTVDLPRPLLAGEMLSVGVPSKTYENYFNTQTSVLSMEATPWWMTGVAPSAPATPAATVASAAMTTSAPAAAAATTSAAISPAPSTVFENPTPSFVQIGPRRTSARSSATVASRTVTGTAAVPDEFDPALQDVLLQSFAPQLRTDGPRAGTSASPPRHGAAVSTGSTVAAATPLSLPPTAVAMTDAEIRAAAAADQARQLAQYQTHHRPV